MASVNITVEDYINNDYNPADNVTILDTTVNLQSLTATQIGNLVTNGVEHIDSSDDVLTWNVAQWQAVPGGLSFDVDDFKVVEDTGAHLAGLSAGDLANLNTYGVTFISVQDDVLSINVAQYEALGGISIDQDATVTLTDSGANLAGMSAAEYGALSIKGVDVIDSSNDILNLTVAQAQGLGSVTLTGADVVTLQDTSSALEALTGNDFAVLGEAGVDRVNATDDVLSLTDDQYSAITNNGMTLTAGDEVTLADTGALITGHDFNTLGENGIDNIDATDDVMSISVNQANELVNGDVIASDTNDVITVSDTSTNIETNLAIGELGGSGVDFIDATDNVLHLTAGELDSLGNADIGLTGSDTVTLADDTAVIDALTQGELGSYIAQGVDVIDAITGSGAYTIDKATASTIAASTAVFAGNDTVTVNDTGANLESLTAAEIGVLKSHGIDALDASDNALSLSVAKYSALNGVTLTAGDTVTLLDSSFNLMNMSVSTISGLEAANVDVIDATDDALALTVAKFNALGEVGLTDADDVTLSDSGANLAALSAVALGNAGEKGVDHLDANDDALNLTVAQAAVVAVGGEIGLTGTDVVTLSDSGANLAAVSDADYFTYGENGVDVIDSNTDAVSFTLAQLDGIDGGGISLTDGDVVTAADTSANLDGMLASTIHALNAMKVDVIDSTQNGTAYTLDSFAAQELITDAITLAQNDTVGLSDTGAHIAALSVAELGALAGEGFDFLDASDDVLNLTVAKASAIVDTPLTFDNSDTVTIVDTGANIAALTTGELGQFDTAGVAALNASDDVLNLTVAQFRALGELSLTSGDAVTLVDTGAHLASLTTVELANLGTLNVDALDASDNAISFSIAQLDALFTGEAGLTPGDVVTLSDTRSNIEALTAGELGGFGEQGVDLIHSDAGILHLTAAQVGAVADESGLAFATDDAVTLLDTGANIAALSAAQFAAMVTDNVDTIDVSDTNLNLRVDQYLAIAGTSTQIVGTDVVTLVDTGANIAAMSAAQFSQLAANGVDRINASNNVLKLTVAQFNGLGAVTLAGGDVVSLTDTGAHLSTLDFSTLAGKNVDAIDATDNTLTITYNQFQQLGTVSLAAGDDVTVTGTSTTFEGLSGSQLLTLGGKGIDHIDTTDNQLHFNLTQFNNLGSVSVAANDVFTILDTGANLANIAAGKINAFNAAGVDFIDSSTGVWNMSAAAAGALADGGAKATAADAVTVVDSGAALAGLSAGELGALGAHNVDALDATDNLLTLSTSQFNALGTVTLTGGDTVTLADTGSLLASLNFAQLAAKGVDILDATDNTLNLTVAKYEALSGVSLTAGDTVTLLDTGAALHALSASEIAGLDTANVDLIDSTTNLLTFDVSQFNALGEVGVSADDVFTVADTGANLAGLGPSLLAAAGVDRIDATDKFVTLSQSFVDAIGELGVALTQTDVVTMTASEGAIEGLSAGDLADYAAQGVDIIDVSGTANMDAAQISAMINTGLKFSPGSDVELDDSSANVIANLGALFGSLGAAGVDRINLSDDGINLTVAQATALNGPVFDSSDTNVRVLDDSASLETLTGDQIFALGEIGVDVVDASDDVLAVNTDQAGAAIFSNVIFADEDVVTLADTGEAIAAGDPSTLYAAGEIGVDFIDATDDVLSLDADQFNAIAGAGIQLTAGDFVTLADTGAELASFSASAIGQLGALGIDAVEITDDAMSLGLSRFKAFQNAGFTFGAEDVITVKGNGSANTMTGGAEHDVFNGLGGADVLNGGQGSDTLIGGAGSDTMSGGAGADKFVFQSINDSTVGAADRIVGLQNVDMIDLAKIDADTTTGGNQAFHVVDHFGGHAGELTIKYNAGSDLTVVKLDVDGDGVADSQIAISGDHHDFTNFVL